MRASRGSGWCPARPPGRRLDVTRTRPWHGPRSGRETRGRSPPRGRRLDAACPARRDLPGPQPVDGRADPALDLVAAALTGRRAIRPFRLPCRSFRRRSSRTRARPATGLSPRPGRGGWPAGRPRCLRRGDRALKLHDDCGSGHGSVLVHRDYLAGPKASPPRSIERSESYRGSPTGLQDGRELHPEARDVEHRFAGRGSVSDVPHRSQDAGTGDGRLPSGFGSRTEGEIGPDGAVSLGTNREAASSSLGTSMPRFWTASPPTRLPRGCQVTSIEQVARVAVFGAV